MASQVRKRRFLARRTAVVFVGLLGIVFISWGRTVIASNHESFAARNAGWMRDNHLGFIVDRVEQVQYANDQPKSGGAPDKALIALTPVPNSVLAPSHPAPEPMPTPAVPPFPGEGMWAPAGRANADGSYGVYTTLIRPNADITTLVDFVAWIDPTLVDVQIIPGTKLPGGTWSHPSKITAAECPQTVLALNGGFRFDQSEGGWYSDGHASDNYPLVDGAASLVVMNDGTVQLGAWGKDVNPANLPNIATVRQNLRLMVDEGAVVANIDDGPTWGAKLKNSLFVWRSGYGITSTGKLVYVGGPGLTPRDLAQRLVDAGAVRGMQGDINQSWVTSNLYLDGPNGCHGTKALNVAPENGGQKSPGDRYLTSDTRDFIAILEK